VLGHGSTFAIWLPALVGEPAPPTTLPSGPPVEPLAPVAPVAPSTPVSADPPRLTP